MSAFTSVKNPASLANKSADSNASSVAVTITVFAAGAVVAAPGAGAVCPNAGLPAITASNPTADNPTSRFITFPRVKTDVPTSHSPAPPAAPSAAENNCCADHLDQSTHSS